METNALVLSFWEAVILALSISHIAVAPFSKVEESFNVQASFDIFFKLWFKEDATTNVTSFDHFSFPGVVPRTFAGPIVLDLLVFPFVYFVRILVNLGISTSYHSKLASFFIVRVMMTLLCWRGFISLGKALGLKYGSKVRKWFYILVSVQFHLLFYSGRLLPNTFATCLALFAYRNWILDNILWTVFILTFTTVVFRCDMIILLGVVGIGMLILHEIFFTTALKVGIFSALFSLSVTTFIDTYFWTPQYPLERNHFVEKLDILKFHFLGLEFIWPEGQVFIYNAVLGNSKNWGTMPFFWYFYSSLPKSLLIALPLAFAGVFNYTPKNIRFDRSMVKFLLVALSFVFIYSFVGHKETRFLFPVLPLFNIVAASGAAKIEIAALSWERGRIRNILIFFRFCLLCSAFLCFCSTICFLFISSQNYPGGQGIYYLNEKLAYDLSSTKNLTEIHVGTYAAMTGVTQFTYLSQADLAEGRSVYYSKAEDSKTLESLCSKDCRFDYILIESREYIRILDKCNANGFTKEREFYGEPLLSLYEFNPFKPVFTNSLILLRKLRT